MLIRELGPVPYAETAAAMQAFTEARGDETEDELWLCEHPPVFTQGIGGKAEHVRVPGDIPVVATNRGGQVTYHGPGQVVVYPLVNLKRLNIFVKEYVYRLEEALLRTLASYEVTGHRVPSAPGIYVKLADPFGHSRLMLPLPEHDPFRGLGKVAALGVKISRHCSYHGVALNVAMDLSPYERINPCGYQGLKTVDLKILGVQATWAEASQRLAHALGRQFAMT